ncbi:MAG: 50S ribosomal protein L3 [Gemmatimonadetes bacterium]|nr:50S ribosomal protein L3 [Gemmatimonadota bacterium]
MPGLIGKKVGMTRIFDDAGIQVPVTVIEAGPCPVVQVRDTELGQKQVQLGFEAQGARQTTRAERGHATKAGLDYAPRLMREFPVDSGVDYQVGQQLTVTLFAVGDRVKVTANSKGRGFTGVVKRHGFGGRPGSHGHPESRTPGTVGPGTDPSRVIKGKRLPGRMGGVRTTIRNLQVVRVDGERNLLFVKGGVPGSRNGYVLISK